MVKYVCEGTLGNAYLKMRTHVVFVEEKILFFFSKLLTAQTNESNKIFEDIILFFMKRERNDKSYASSSIIYPKEKGCCFTENETLYRSVDRRKREKFLFVISYQNSFLSKMKTEFCEFVRKTDFETLCEMKTNKALVKILMNLSILECRAIKKVDNGKKLEEVLLEKLVENNFFVQWIRKNGRYKMNTRILYQKQMAIELIS